MFRMSNGLRRAMERSTGLSHEDTSRMSPDELKQYVELKRGEELKFGEVRLPDFTGDPLLDTGRVVTNEEIEGRINEILGDIKFKMKLLKVLRKKFKK